MTWYEAWGTWKRDPGVPSDVMMVGGPGNSHRGLPMGQAHQSGRGRGIQFTASGTSVKVDYSLVGATSLNAMWTGHHTGYLGPGFSIYASGWDYGWVVTIEVSTDGGNSYRTIVNEVRVATHYTPQGLAYNPGSSAIKPWTSAIIEWSTTVNLPDNFTHLRTEIKGTEPAQRNWNIYTREQIIPKPELTTKWVNNGKDLAPTVVDFEFHGPKDFEPEYKYGGATETEDTRTHNYIRWIKPWAIRKSGIFKTLDRRSGFFRIRKSGSWADKSRHLETDVGKENQGVARIRKSGKWLGQNRIGED